MNPHLIQTLENLAAGADATEYAHSCRSYSITSAYFWIYLLTTADPHYTAEDNELARYLWHLSELVFKNNPIFLES